MEIGWLNEILHRLGFSLTGWLANLLNRNRSPSHHNLHFLELYQKVHYANDHGKVYTVHEKKQRDM